MPFQNLVLEYDGPVATLTLNRPQALNTLDQATIQELGAALDAVAADEALRVLLITGAGDRAFAAGADIKELRAVESASDGARIADRTHAIFQKLVDLRKPVIAVVNGYALGGGFELALACDIRIAADTAVVGLPEVSLGLIPGWGGTTRLARLVGTGTAKLLIFTAARLSASEARDLGILERVVPASELMAAARTLATSIAAMPPLALAAAKQSINRGHDLALLDANAYEAALFSRVASSEDAREGTSAFLEKRAAVWKGR